MDKVTERSLCAEKMKGTDSLWENEQKREEWQRAEPNMKFQAMFPSFGMEKISTDSYTSSDPVYFDWKSRGKPQVDVWTDLINMTVRNINYHPGFT